MKFKTEEERQKALEAIPQDPPPNVNLEKWREETIAKLEEVNNAEIDETAEPVQAELEKEGKESEKKETPEDIEDAAQARVREMTNLMAEQRKKHEAEKQEMLQKVKEMEEKAKKPPEPDRPDPKIEQKDQEIATVRRQIDELEKNMNIIGDVHDEDYLKGLNQKASLSVKLAQITMERANLDIQRHNEEFKKMKEDQEKARLEDKKKKDQEDRQRKIEEQRQIQIKEINKLRGHEKYKGDFLSKSTYDKMEAETNAFGRQCAAAYTGKAEDEVNDEEIELSMQRYLNKSPQLLERIQEMKIKEPKEMREFLIMTDVFGLKEGIQLNKKTGKWEKIVDDYGSEVRFPTVEAAYEYYKEKHGITGKDLLDAEKKTAAGIVAAINKRANVKELSSAAQSTRNTGMDLGTAQDIVNKWDANDMVDLARHGKLTDPRLKTYNQALEALGQAPIDESW